MTIKQETFQTFQLKNLLNLSFIHFLTTNARLVLALRCDRNFFATEESKTWISWMTLGWVNYQDIFILEVEFYFKWRLIPVQISEEISVKPGTHQADGLPSGNVKWFLSTALVGCHQPFSANSACQIGGGTWRQERELRLASQLSEWAHEKNLNWRKQINNRGNAQTKRCKTFLVKRKRWTDDWSVAIVNRQVRRPFCVLFEDVRSLMKSV